MFIGEYRFKFYLNARHTIKIDNYSSNVHPHTWEIVLHVTKKSEDFIRFSRIEDEIQSFLSTYEGKLLNDIPPFDSIEPTMENIGEVIGSQVIGILDLKGWDLYKLEISENPTRTYIITKEKSMVATSKVAVQHLEIHRERSIMEAFAGDFPADEKQKDPDGIVCGNKINANQESGAEQKQSDGLKEQDIFYQESAAAKEKCFEAQSPFQTKNRAEGLKYLLVSMTIVFAVSVLIILWVTRCGLYPWGSDTWGHLLKARLLYEEVMSGNLFPLYSDIWYNGIQPFRYWAPLPYYILLVFGLVAGGNVILAYNIFIAFVFVAGAIPWILWGKKTGKKKLALVLALIWFFIPENLRVLFAEGNIPRVVVSTVFPYLLLFVWNFLEYKKNRYLALVSFCMLLITISHAMISAMSAVVVFLYGLWYSVLNKRPRAIIKISVSILLGTAAAGIWLYPALKGGMMSLDQEALREVMKLYTFPLLQSVNPVLRFRDIEIFYFGLSILLISLLGFSFADKKSKAGFGVVLLIFLGTTRELLPLLTKMPMNQLFWPMRFAPMAMAVFLASLLLWKRLNKKLLYVMLFAVIFDSIASFGVLAYNRGLPENYKKALDPAIDITHSRIAVLDLSSFGSFPSYYLSCNDKGKQLKQVYGWAWQGAKTSQNIVWLNTAFENQWYSFMFDRCLELGADTVVIRKDMVEDIQKLVYEARKIGFETQSETGLSLVFKYPVNHPFGTKTRYKGFGIGSYAENLSYIFPQFEIGRSIYIDDYPVDKLLGYKALYLSGFKYRSKKRAEEIVRSISEAGVKVIIDLTNADLELYSSRASFLNVLAQPVVLKNRYPVIQLEEKRIEFKSRIPEEYNTWRTIFFENLDKSYGSIEFNNQEMDVLGTKLNDNIVYVGLNIPFFAMMTGDEKGIELLESITGFDALRQPERKVTRLDVVDEGSYLSITSQTGGVITGIASLDTFRSEEGNFSERHNLVFMEDKQLKLKIVYPYFKEGLIISVLGLLLAAVFYIQPLRKKLIKAVSDCRILKKVGGGL